MSDKRFRIRITNIHNELDAISKDEYILKDFPRLSKLFDVLGDILYLIIKDLDYFATESILTKNEKAKRKFQKEAIEKIKEIINKC